MRLEGKAALITGAGSGIGRAAAELFSREGARLVISGRRPEPLEETAAALRAAGGEVTAVPGDVSRAEDARRMIAAVVDAYGKLDVMFCNAGVQHRTNVVDMPEEAYDHLMTVNVKGFFLCAKYGIPEMIKAGGGSIVVNSSTVGLHGMAGANVYAASKGACIALAKSIAHEYGPQGVRANAVCPALVDTEMPRSRVKPGDDWNEALKGYLKDYPLGRIGTPEDIARAVLFLAGDESSWITGVALVLDGGSAI